MRHCFKFLTIIVIGMLLVGCTDRYPILDFWEEIGGWDDIDKTYSAGSSQEDRLNGFNFLKEIFDSLDNGKEEVNSDDNPNEQLNSIINEAESLADGDVEGAIIKIQSGLRTYPQSADLQNKLDEYTERLATQVKAETLDKAAELAASGDYVTAMALIETAQKDSPEDKDYKSAYDSYAAAHKSNVVNEALENADTLSANGDYLGALRTVNQALKSVGDDNTLSFAAKMYEEACAKSISAQVDAYMAEQNITAAKQLLDTASKEIPNNAVINEQKTEVDKYKTVSLSTLSPINCSNSWNSPEEQGVRLENALGQSFNDAINSYAPWQDGYGEYFIDGMYTSITGNITSLHHMKEERESYLRIYADNVAIYTSPIITRKSKVIPFTVDIPSGTQTIRFECKADNYSYSNILLTDIMLNYDPSVSNNSPLEGAISLRSLNPVNSGGSWNNEASIIKNALGQYYIDSFNHFIPHQDSYGEYYIDGAYKKITGNLTSWHSMGEQRKCYLQIIADDTIIYSSPTITRNTEVLSFSLDIPEGTQFIKLICKADNYSHSEILLTDVLLWS